jgi:hypothetical protein
VIDRILERLIESEGRRRCCGRVLRADIDRRAQREQNDSNQCESKHRCVPAASNVGRKV